MNTAVERWTRLSDLFDELADADADARARRLRELDAADLALATELRRMLAADRADTGLLDQGLGLATLGAIAAQAPARVDRSGTRIDDYRLESLLGRGGMGEVYLATRMAQGFEQRVALKLMRRGVDSEDGARRFALERRILARLEHPNIARLIDGGIGPEGLPYLVMELVEGLPITGHAQSAAFALEPRLRLVQSACAAVDYAHRQLIVHRDLKPSNMLVTSDGTVKLLDFGIAKLLEPGDGDELVTGSALRALSPAYAAPEQILGEPIGTAADVYALGVVLFEMLTGQLPHQRRTASLELLVQGLSGERPPQPSALLLQQARDDAGADSIGLARRGRRLQGDLDTIVLKALAREPARRYGTAAALSEDLQRFLDGRPIAARPDTVGYRLNRFVRRHRGGVAASIIALVALVGGLGLALWQARVAEDHAARANREAQRAEAEADAARQMTARSKRAREFLSSIFLQEDPLRRDARGELTLKQAFDDALARIDSELAGDPSLQADLLDDFGEIVAGKGDFARAQTLFERALATAERAHGPNHPAVAESLVNLGVIAGYRGNASDGKAPLERARAILEPYAASQPVALASALSALANIEFNEGEIESAVTGFRRALALHRASGLDDAQLLSIMGNLGGALIAAGYYDEAEPLLHETLERTERQFGAQAPTLVPPLRLLALVSAQRGRVDEERAYYERVLALARAAFPKDHPWTADGLTETGWCLVRQGQVEEGEGRMRDAVAMLDRLGNKGQLAASAWRQLGLSQDRRGDANALSSLERSWGLCQGTSFEQGKVCQAVRVNRARMLARAGSGDEALREADSTLVAISKRQGRTLDLQAQAHEARAAAFVALDRRTEAVAAQKQALLAYTQAYVPGHDLIERARRDLAALESGIPIAIPAKR